MKTTIARNYTGPLSLLIPESRRRLKLRTRETEDDGGQAGTERKSIRSESSAVASKKIK